MSILLVRGIPASGKSTYAKQYVKDNPEWVRVSRDDIRRMLYVEPDHSWEQEKVVTELEKQAVESALKAGKSVIVDAMNLRSKYVREWMKVAERLGVALYSADFPITLDEAIERDAAREGVERVGSEFITSTFNKFCKKDGTLKPPPKMRPEEKYTPKEYSGTPGKPKAFLVDIDGTLAHNRGGRGWYDWNRVDEDDLDEVIADIVYRLSVDYSENYKIIVMSGRDEVCREITERWLRKHGVYFDALFMRAEKDMRKDNIVKEELFNKYVRDNYDVKFVIDDRLKVVQMWQRMGLKVLNVAGLDGGDF